MVETLFRPSHNETPETRKGSAGSGDLGQSLLVGPRRLELSGVPTSVYRAGVFGKRNLRDADLYVAGRAGGMTVE